MFRLADAGDGTPLYRLRITLRGCKPPIWRRVVVRADMRIAWLHRVIQIALGWLGGDHYHFRVGRMCYGIPDPALDNLGGESLDEKPYTLSDLAPTTKKRIIYEYDLDCWVHEIVVEGVLPPNAHFKHPLCLDGANACPPEDCGGTHGYAEFLDAMADPRHQRHEQMKAWIGCAWDATRFSLAGVNARLKSVKA